MTFIAALRLRGRGAARPDPGDQPNFGATAVATAFLAVLLAGRTLPGLVLSCVLFGVTQTLFARYVNPVWAGPRDHLAVSSSASVPKACIPTRLKLTTRSAPPACSWHSCPGGRAALPRHVLPRAAHDLALYGVLAVSLDLVWGYTGIPTSAMLFGIGASRSRWRRRSSTLRDRAHVPDWDGTSPASSSACSSPVPSPPSSGSCRSSARGGPVLHRDRDPGAHGRGRDDLRPATPVHGRGQRDLRHRLPRAHQRSTTCPRSSSSSSRPARSSSCAATSAGHGRSATTTNACAGVVELMKLIVFVGGAMTPRARGMFAMIEGFVRRSCSTSSSRRRS